MIKVNKAFDRKKAFESLNVQDVDHAIIRPYRQKIIWAFNEDVNLVCSFYII